MNMHTLWDFFFFLFHKKVEHKITHDGFKNSSEVSQFNIYAKYIKEIGVPLELVGDTFSDFI